MGSLFGSSKSKSTQTQRVDVPDWALPGLQEAMSMARDASSTPYEAYSDPRIAQFSADELGSFEGVRGIQGAFQPAFNQANDILETVARSGLEGFSQDYLNQYMNPYIQNVLDVQRDRSLDNYSQQMNDYRARAGQASAFGGSRFGLGEAQMQQNFQRQLAENEALGLASAYESGLAGAERGMARAGQAGLSMADLAAMGQGLSYQDYAALNAQGGQQRALEQAGLDFDYEQWIRERAHPYEQAQFLAGIASPIAGQVSGSTTNTTTKQSSDPGILGTALALGSMALGIPGVGSMMGGLGSSLGMSFGAANSVANVVGGQWGQNFINQWAGAPSTATAGWQNRVIAAKGGQIPFSKGYAGGGVVSGGGLAGFLDGVGGTMKDFMSFLTTPEGRAKLAQDPAIQAGNSLAEWAVENPVDALATVGLTAAGGGPAMAATGLAGRGGLGAIKAASKIHPKLLVGVPSAAYLARDYLFPDAGEEEALNKVDPGAMLSALNSAGIEDSDFMAYHKSREGQGPSPYQQAVQMEADRVASEAIKDTDDSVSGLQTAATQQAKEEGWKPSPLFMFGAKLLQGHGLAGLGAAAEFAGKYADSQQSEQAKVARQQFEDSVERYKLEQQDRKIKNSEQWQQIQASAINHPYKLALQELTMAEKVRKLEQDPNQKMKLDMYKAMASNPDPRIANSPEAIALRDELMKSMGGGSGTSGSMPALPTSSSRLLPR